MDHVGQQIADCARDVLNLAYNLEAKSAALTVPEPAFSAKDVAEPILVTVLGVGADLIERAVAQGRKPHAPRLNRLRKLEASVLAKRAIATSVAERS